MLKRQDRETLMRASGKIEAVAILLKEEGLGEVLFNAAEMIDEVLRRDDLSVVTAAVRTNG